MIGAETWAAITGTLEGIDPLLSPSWLEQELAALALPLDRPHLMAGLNRWRKRIESRKLADRHTREEHKIVHWRAIAGKELRDALLEVRHDD